MPNGSWLPSCSSATSPTAKSSPNSSTSPAAPSATTSAKSAPSSPDSGTTQTRYPRATPTSTPSEQSLTTRPVESLQLHKLRNVRDRLPEKLRTVVERRMRKAYHAETALAAQAELEALAAELDKTHPGAAASLREGLPETLTVLRLGVPPTLARTLRSTNPIESMIEICREHAKNVKNWKDGQMALRWAAAGMLEAGKQFRRVNGHLHLPALRTALDAEARRTVAPVVHDEGINAA